MWSQNSRRNLGITVTTNAMNATAFDGSGQMYAGNEYNGGDPASGSQFNTAGQGGCGVQLATGGRATGSIRGNPGGCDNGDCCILNQLGAKACSIPGNVTSAQPLSGFPTQVKCSYNQIDPTWLNNHIQSLGSYFDSKNAGIAGLMWCNNLSLSDLYNKQGDCKTYASAGNIPYNQFLTQKLAGSEWFNDPNGTNLMSGACSTKDQSADSSCSSLIQGIPSTWIPTSGQVDQMNSIMKNGSQPVQTALKNTVQSICDANPTKEFCACYNISKYKLDGCLANSTLPGCKDTDIQQAAQLKELLTSMGDAGRSELTNLGNFEQNLVMSSLSCVSGTATGGGNLLPFSPVGQTIQLNQCATSIDLSGASLDRSSLSASCNIGSDSGPTKPPLPPQDNTGLIAGIGGGGLFSSSCSCSILILVLIVAMSH
jgi:hypothetical protein